MTENKLFEESGEETKITPPTIEDKNYLDELVGEDKKFKDAEALAKGKAESDAFIQKLQEEQAGLREQLKQSLTMEQFMDRLEESRATSTDRNVSGREHTTQSVSTPSDMDTTTSSFNNEDVRKLIDQVVEEQVSQRDLRRTYENNVAQVHTKAREVLGEDYKSKLDNRAKALNLNVEYLSELASKNPQGFINIMVEPKTFDSSGSLFSGAPASEINSAALGKTTLPQGAKPKSYFDKLKEADPVKYWSPQVQVEMHQAAKELGIETFNRN